MNADPRRPEKVQRFVPKANNGTGQEDLTPDYMNILGQHQQTASVVTAATPQAAVADDKHGSVVDGGPSVGVGCQLDPNLQQQQHTIPQQQSAGGGRDEIRQTADETVSAANVIPTSPQYGVAIIPPQGLSVFSAGEMSPETTTTSSASSSSAAPPPVAEAILAAESMATTTVKPPDENKELHSTPSRNDRFKVVKIASLEPFKRGRWKCMDYVDEAPPAGMVRVPQSTGSIQVPTAAYLQQTQSLPQQQIQQMLLQGGFVTTNGGQFFQPQMMPPGQYIYTQQQGTPNQTMPPQQVASSMPANQFITNQPYFPAAGGFTMPQNFQNVQYIPANLIQNQNSAFVPTSQMTANFQQSQTYAGQTQPLVNGHTFTDQQQQANMPTQTVKSVIMNSQQQIQQSLPTQMQLQSQQQQNNQTVPVVGQQFQQQNPSYPSNQNSNQQPTQNVMQVQPQQQQQPQLIQQPNVQSQQNFDAGNVYTNPQFAVSVNSLTILDNPGEGSGPIANVEVTETNSVADAASENADDPAKTNPVVNAIDNKIEQAMDLVKSHLMYTVREEVEVLKEKIAELMERIQQLETENNFLRSQIPKNQGIVSQQTSVSVAATNASQAPSPNFIPSSNTSHNPIPTNSVQTSDVINATQM